MRLLICALRKVVAKSSLREKIAGGSRILTEKHIKAIKTAAPKLEIEVVSTPADAIRRIGNADILAGSPRMIAGLPITGRIKWIHSFSAGMDRILTPEVVKSAVLLSNSSGIAKVPIAEHVIAYMLMFSRGFLRSLRNQEKRVWQRDETLAELCGKTVLVVGLGNIGGEVARLAHCFGTRIIGVTKSTRQKIGWVDALKTPSQLDKTLPSADFVVSSLPHTKQTHHLFSLRKFRLMKASAVFINIGRGGLVNEKDLVQALKQKIIAGAALDVTETEPLPASSSLWRMPNVIITPHHSATSEHTMDRTIEGFCLNLKAFLIGDRLPNLVDKKLGY